MAIVKKPGDPEEEGQDALGTGAGAGGDVGGGTESGAGAPRATADGGTGFVNISDYLKANEGGGEKVGKVIEGALEKDITGAQQQGDAALQKSLGEINARGQDEYLRADTNWDREAGAFTNANPYQFNRADVDSSGLQRQLGRLGSTGGTADFLRETTGNRSGISALDSALLSGETGAYRPEEIKNRSEGRLNEYLKNAEGQVGQAMGTRSALEAQYNSAEAQARRRALGNESAGAYRERDRARDWFGRGRAEMEREINSPIAAYTGSGAGSGRGNAQAMWESQERARRADLRNQLQQRDSEYQKWKGK